MFFRVLVYKFLKIYLRIHSIYKFNYFDLNEDKWSENFVFIFTKITTENHEPNQKPETKKDEKVII